ncbi:hypothetical protein XI08_08515 [Bradyrhizobium sp. CCBAU 11361]|nr:hypothetical protein [Bradyrhizobium sp. CCBAU 11361]
MATRKELTAAAGARYRRSDRAKKARILDEFVDITGYHRKHAIPVGRSKSPGYGHLKLPHLMIAVSATEQQ